MIGTRVESLNKKPNNGGYFFFFFVLTLYKLANDRLSVHCLNRYVLHRNTDLSACYII